MSRAVFVAIVRGCGALALRYVCVRICRRISPSVALGSTNPPRDLVVRTRSPGVHDALARVEKRRTAMSDLHSRLRALGLITASGRLDDLVALATKKRWADGERRVCRRRRRIAGSTTIQRLDYSSLTSPASSHSTIEMQTSSCKSSVAVTRRASSSPPILAFAEWHTVLPSATCAMFVEVHIDDVVPDERSVSSPLSFAPTRLLRAGATAALSRGPKNSSSRVRSAKDGSSAGVLVGTPVADLKP